MRLTVDLDRGEAEADGIEMDYKKAVYLIPPGTTPDDSCGNRLIYEFSDKPSGCGTALVAMALPVLTLLMRFAS